MRRRYRTVLRSGARGSSIAKATCWQSCRIPNATDGTSITSVAAKVKTSSCRQAARSFSAASSRLRSLERSRKMKRAVAVTLKIPDNTAYTAAVALRNLGLPVERVERSEIWFFNDAGDPAALLSRIESDATIFNPNKHRATMLDRAHHDDGELWVLRQAQDDTRQAQDDSRQAQDDTPEPSGPGAIAWRLFVSGQRRADRRLLAAAAEGLLCNPAIERASFYSAQDDNVGSG